MRILKFEAQSYRCFGNLEVTFDCSKNVHIVVAKNGFGKTALLAGVASLLGSYLFHLGINSLEETAAIQHSDVRTNWRRFGESGMSSEPNYPCTLRCLASLFGENVGWARALNSNTSRFNEKVKNAERLRELLNKNRSSDDGTIPNLPVIAFYRTDRFGMKGELGPSSDESPIPQPRQTVGRIESPNAGRDPMLGYLEALKGTTSWTMVEDWMFLESSSANVRQQSRTSSMEAAFRITKQVLNLAEAPYYDPREGALFLRFADDAGFVPHRRISDGYRVVLGVALDLVRRISILNPHLAASDLVNTKGVVLIDEIDMHLHPKWQQGIISQLSDAFPNIQFIVSTHAPLVINGSAEVAETIVLEKDEQDLDATPVVLSESADADATLT